MRGVHMWFLLVIFTNTSIRSPVLSVTRLTEPLWTIVLGRFWCHWVVDYKYRQSINLRKIDDFNFNRFDLTHYDCGGCRLTWNLSILWSRQISSSSISTYIWCLTHEPVDVICKCELCEWKVVCWVTTSISFLDVLLNVTCDKFLKQKWHYFKQKV